MIWWAGGRYKTTTLHIWLLRSSFFKKSFFPNYFFLSPPPLVLPEVVVVLSFLAERAGLRRGFPEKKVQHLMTFEEGKIKELKMSKLSWKLFFLAKKNDKKYN